MIDQPLEPFAPQRDKDPCSGRFLPGHKLGNRFQPGQSGNPTGRPKGITFPGDWLRGFSNATQAELEAVANDQSQPTTRRAAAKHILDCLDDDPAIRLGAFTALVDRTEGKPHLSLTVEREPPIDPVALLAELRRKYTRRG